MMKSPFKNLLLIVGSQLIIGILLLHGAIRRIEQSHNAESLRQKLRAAEQSATRYEQRYYALTATPRIATEARKIGFIPAPFTAIKHYKQDFSEQNR